MVTIPPSIKLKKWEILIGIKISRIKNQFIAVRLKRQPVLPVWEEALFDWKRKTRFKSFEVSVINRLNGENPKSWIDAELFKRAIFNLMDIAARTCGNDDGLSFSIVPAWQGSCRIIIGYPRMMKNTNEDEEDMKVRPDSETIEIISQHRGKIEILEEKYRETFLIYLPN